MVWQKIRKRDGSLVDFDPERIVNAIFKAACAVAESEGKSADRTIAEGLKEKVIEKLKDKIHHNTIPAVEAIQDVVEEVLIENGHTKTAKAYILYRYERAKIRKEKASLIGKIVTTDLSTNSLKVLKERYLLKDDFGRVIEVPREMFERVAKNVAQAEKLYDKDPDSVEKEFFEIMSDLEFLPNSPTLMNAGTKVQQLVSCFALKLDDSVSGIFDTLKLAMLIHTSGAGTGYSFSGIRPKGSQISTNKGKASGPVSFLRIFDFATEIIKKGGNRRGANMGVMKVDHPDILEFIHCKDREGDIRNFNVSVGLTNDFMDAVSHNNNYNLLDPKTKKMVGVQNARTVFDSIVTNSWQTGDPGVLFLDKINKDNPLPSLGHIEITSPCGEVPLFEQEACTLGSINLGKFVKEKGVDFERLGKVVSLAVNFLDNVLDMTKYHTKEIKDNTLSNRKIGLGVMGFADLLYKIRVPYNSNLGLEIAEKVMKFIMNKADESSSDLAKKRGNFPNWDKSVYAKKGIKMRNATRLAIAPTGSISMIADCSPGIEPVFAISYIKTIYGDKELFYLDNNFKEALEERRLDVDKIVQRIVSHGSVQSVEELPKELRKVFVVAHDISPDWHIKMQVAFQKYVDNAISKTINVPHDFSIKDVEKIYLKAFELGSKGITVYRDGSKDKQIINLSPKTEF